ncbi:MAG: hypothetical protein AAFX87_01545 [Bacteroidota bacterium]
MERVVIAAFQPKPGHEKALETLMLNHWDSLNKLGLVSDRKPIIMQSENGTFVEVFGWKSKEAIEAAHSNEEVLKMWEEYAKVCDYVPISQVNESQSLFSEFIPVN